MIYIILQLWPHLTASGETLKFKAGFYSNFHDSDFVFEQW